MTISLVVMDCRASGSTRLKAGYFRPEAQIEKWRRGPCNGLGEGTGAFYGIGESPSGTAGPPVVLLAAAVVTLEVLNFGFARGGGFPSRVHKCAEHGRRIGKARSNELLA